jgi:phosphoenolpyruvate-protein kinase (PTS system EI component)
MGGESAGATEPSVRFRGLPVSAGTAAGMLRIIGDTAVDDTTAAATPEDVTAAFAAVAAERSALAERLRAAGRGSEADIIGIGALIAGDPSLSAPAIAAMRGGADAATAVREATEGHAAAMEKLDNPELAERAGDIRQIASAVLERLRTGRGAADREAGAEAGDFILVRREVSPADLIELAEAGLVGAVSVAGGASSHAAIVARGLGVPMIAGASPEVLALSPGLTAVLDADSGELVVGGEGGAGQEAGEGGRGARERADAQRAADVQRRRTAREAADDKRLAHPPRTADGHEVVVLCNVASAVETRRGLAAGAAGVGLLRTELPYTQAADWPTLAQDRSQLGPILELLADRTAVVRLLDFSGDKIPPFLAREAGEEVAERVGGAAAAEVGQAAAEEVGAAAAEKASGSGTAEAGRAAAAEAGREISLPAGAGLAALLAHPFALAEQLRAILETGRDARLAVLIPMVSSLREVSRVREVLAETAGALGVATPPLGIMVELESTAANAAAFAPAVDFFSIGTNDLTGDVLGLGRRDQAAGPALAAHPRVLALVKGVAEAGREAGITVSVCGDSAADARVLPLLVGAGVRTVSVPAARVTTVRSWISNLNSLACKELTERALAASTAAEVWDLVPAL